MHVTPAFYLNIKSIFLSVRFCRQKPILHKPICTNILKKKKRIMKQKNRHIKSLTK